jgi:hypothetical protein
VFARSPLIDAEVSKFLDVGDPGRSVFVVEGGVDPGEGFCPEDFLVV